MSFYALAPVGSPAVLYDRISNPPSLGCPFFVHNISEGGPVMNKISGTLTVYFEKPFWICVFEQVDQGKVSVSRIIFATEPSDRQIWNYILYHYQELSFSSPVEANIRPAVKNPKRRQRAVKKQMRTKIGTKSQQALQRQQEQNKQERSQKDRERKALEKEKKYQIKQQKKKKKRKGR